MKRIYSEKIEVVSCSNRCNLHNRANEYESSRGDDDILGWRLHDDVRRRPIASQIPLD